MSESRFSWLNDFPDLKTDAIQLSNLEQTFRRVSELCLLKNVWTKIKLIKWFVGFKTDAIQLSNLEQNIKKIDWTLQAERILWDPRISLIKVQTMLEVPSG